MRAPAGGADVATLTRAAEADLVLSLPYGREAASLLAEVHDPSIDDIRLGLSGNLCRCTGYYPIMQAIQRASVVDVELDS